MRPLVQPNACKSWGSLLACLILLSLVACEQKPVAAVPVVQADALPSSDAGLDAPVSPDQVSPSDAGSACKAMADCAAAAPYCDRQTGSCVACLYGPQCAVGARCVDHACVAPVACQSDKVCLGAGGVCDKAAGVCVDCLSDGDCPTPAAGTGAKVCRARQCIAAPGVCKGSKDCNAFGQVCDTAKSACVECTGTPDCASTEFCTDSLCLPTVCLPGGATCSGLDSVLTCNAEGSASTSSSCGAGAACEKGKCVAQICKPAGQRCEGATVQTCNPAGTAWVDGPACSGNQTCLDGACLAHVCLPDSVTCEGASLRTCAHDGLGSKDSACENGQICDTGACKPLVCLPFAKTCIGTQVIQCDAFGLTAAIAQDCGASKVCKNGECLEKVCVPGVASCDNGGTLQTCSVDGLSLVPQACAPGTVCDLTSCKLMICAPGAKKCSGTKLLQCDAKGLNQGAVQDCAASGKQCVDGACTAQVCTPDSIVCSGNGLRTCSANGLSFTDKACAASTSCDAGQCKPQVCTPNAKSCDGVKIVQCDGKGLGTALVTDCGTSAKLCLQGACSEKLCDPGSVACQGNAVGVCSSDGKQWNVTPCDDKNPCTSDICDAKTSTCSPGLTKGCDDGLPCTIDECNTWTGNCDHTALTGACNDGSACTTGDVCVGNQCVADPYGMVSTVAGTGQQGASDGPMNSATFYLPTAIVRGGDGTLYLSDQGGPRIRKISPAGIVSTLAGDGIAGFQDGPGAQARFSSPAGVAVDALGNVFVADQNNHRIRRVAPDGTVSTVAGSGAGGSQDGSAQSATFSSPIAIVRGVNGDLFVADSANHRIRRISVGGIVSTFSGGAQGYKDGAAGVAQFNNPIGLALDPNGKLYVTDSINQRIRVVAADGSVSTLAGSGAVGFADGPGTSAQFANPYGLAWSPAGALIVADAGNYRIRLVYPDGSVTTVAGYISKPGWTDGPGKQALFNYPSGVAVDTAGAILVADRNNNRIRKIVPNTMTCQDNSPCTTDACDAKTGQCVFTAIGTGKPCDDGTACTSGELCDAAGKCAASKVTTCDDGNVCTNDACDPYSGKCVFGNNVSACSTGDGCNLSTVCQAGACAPGKPMVATLAGQATAGFQNGVGKAAKFQSITGVARSASGDLYFADQANQRVRRVAVDGAVTTLAGSGAAGNADGPGSEATFNNPSGVAVDKAGNVFVTDTVNQRIRRVTPGGVVSTFAGSSAGYLDGQGTSAQFNTPFGLTIDAFGNLYVSDAANQRIRKVSAKGVVTTLAGSGQQGYLDGQASSAQFSGPRGLALDNNGNLFIAEISNHIRRLSPQGVVSTVAGSGQAGFVDGAASSAQFNSPFGVAIDIAGNLLVADSANRRIRTIAKDGTVATLAGSGGQQLLDGSGIQAAFLYPYGIVLDPQGTIVVADLNAVRTIAPQVKICDDGSPCTTDSCDAKTGGCTYTKQPAKTPCNDGNACTTGEACDANGACAALAKTCDDSNPCTTDACNPYSADCENLANDGPCDDGSACTLSDHCLGGKCSTDKAFVTTLAGGKSSGYLDGVGANAAFYGPHGIAIDAAGNVYVADQSNQRIRKMSPDGKVTTVAGSGQAGYLDGPGSSAQFNSPADVAVDKFGTLYVADANNHRIRKISPLGVVSTLAGSGQTGYLDGAGSSAKFNFPLSVAVDGNGKAYVADMNNQRIRTIAPDGTVGTLAGSGQQGGSNGPGTSASFSSPNGLAVDALGHVFVTEGNSHDVRHIAPDGNVDLVAGGGQGYVEGKGQFAKFFAPSDVAVGADGALYVADSGNKRIRRIDKDSTVSTWAGSGVNEFKDGVATQAGFPTAQGIAIAADGALVVADFHGIRRISSLGTFCVDGLPCTTDVCDKATAKCSFPVIANGGGCEDGDPCSVAETCNSSVCGGGKQNTCDDADVCTIDSCEVAVGCKHAPSGAPGCCAPYALENHFDGKDVAGFTFTPMQGSVGWQVWNPAAKSQSASGVLYYGSTSNFNNGSTNSGSATSAEFAVPKANPSVSFWYFADTENGSYDVLSLKVQQQSGAQATLWVRSTVGSWQKITVNLSKYAGQPVKLVFAFDTIDSSANGGLGVLIDDVQVSNNCP